MQALPVATQVLGMLHGLTSGKNEGGPNLKFNNILRAAFCRFSFTKKLRIQTVI